MCYIISVSKQQSKPKQGDIMKMSDVRVVRITRSGFIYVNGKKVSPRRVTPFYYGQDVLTNEEQEVARKWAHSRYTMVNN